MSLLQQYSKTFDSMLPIPTKSKYDKPEVMDRPKTYKDIIARNMLGMMMIVERSSGGASLKRKNKKVKRKRK